MKALSIISIILSLFLIGSSLVMAPPNINAPDYCNEMGIRLLIHILLGLFFLAFSIVATIKSFKKKSI
jgi:hypothetical protein